MEKINNSISKEARVVIALLTSASPASLKVSPFLPIAQWYNLSFYSRIASSWKAFVTNSSPHGVFLPVVHVCVCACARTHVPLCMYASLLFSICLFGYLPFSSSSLVYKIFQNEDCVSSFSFVFHFKESSQKLASKKHLMGIHG